MKLSEKCRSGRERVRVVFQRPSGRGGKTPHTFSNDERVAAKGNGDVVVPAWEAPSLEVVDAELALQVLVDTLGPPSLHDDPDEFPLVDVLGQGRKEVVGRLLLAVAPLNEEPLGIGLGIDACRCDSPKREARGEVLFGPFPPGAAPEAVAGLYSQREVANVHRVAPETGLRVSDPNARLGVDTDGVLEAQAAQGLA